MLSAHQTRRTTSANQDTQALCSLPIQQINNMMDKKRYIFWHIRLACLTQSVKLIYMTKLIILRLNHVSILAQWKLPINQWFGKSMQKLGLSQQAHLTLQGSVQLIIRLITPDDSLIIRWSGVFYFTEILLKSLQIQFYSLCNSITSAWICKSVFLRLHNFSSLIQWCRSREPL